MTFWFLFRFCKNSLILKAYTAGIDSELQGQMLSLMLLGPSNFVRCRWRCYAPWVENVGKGYPSRQPMSLSDFGVRLGGG